MAKNIVIVGGSFAGIMAAKEIFAKGDKNVRVTVISSSKKAYFNVSSPRILIEPEHTEKVFFNVEDALKKYSNGVPYEYIYGTVETSDFDKNTLSVNVNNETKICSYDYLILASGAKAKLPALKIDGDYNNSIASLKELNGLIKKASKIAVIGGGATGCEISGELGYAYGKTKSITLFAGSGPLSFLGEGRSKSATKKLTDLNVVVKNIVVTDYSEHSITGKDGSEESFDLVIPAHGIVPNTKYIDDKFLDKGGFLKTSKSLRVEGYNNVFAFGDIIAIGGHSIVDIKFQQFPVLKEFVSRVIFGSADAELKSQYSRGKTTIVIPISRSGGIGVLFGWSVPSFLVKFLKSKDFFVSKAKEDLT